MLNLRFAVDDPAKNISIASVSRRSNPGGPISVSGSVRLLQNWASRMKNGRPPK